MRKKNIIPTLLSAALIISATGCAEQSQVPESTSSDVSVTSEVSTIETEEETTTAPIDPQEESLAAIKEWSTITLHDNSSTSSDNTVKISDENKITIKEGGYYAVSGSLSNGVLSVKTTDDNADVVIKLCGVNINNEEKTALKIKNAGHVTIYLEEGSDNTITSGKETVIVEKLDSDVETNSDEEVASGGAINSSCDLLICGSGSLNVKGYVKMGIHSKKKVTINNGKLNVISVANAIKGNAGVDINNGSIDILSGNDSIKASSVDGIASDVVINGGHINISAYGDGMQADGNVTTNGGSVYVAMSKEGIEAPVVTINGGALSITSSDDGINASKAASAGEATLNINGGSIRIDALGDGIDSNGDIYITGGTTIIDGPTKAKSGALDNGDENGGVLVITGGTVLAIGSSGSDKVFNDASTQCAFEVHANYNAGDTISIMSGDTSLIQHLPEKAGSSIVFSSPDLSIGETYTVNAGSNSVTITQDKTVVNDMNK